MPTETEVPPIAEQPPTAAVAIPMAAAPAQDRRVTVDQLAMLPDSERRTNWINALVEAEIARQNYAQDKALAREFAICGQFDELKGATMEQAVATAMVKVQLGRAWGFNAADSIRYIYFTNGRPAVENEIVASKLQQAGYDWDVEWLEETVQHKGRPWQKCVGCRLWLKKWRAAESTFKPVLDRNGKPISVSFTEADADHAMIWEKGKQIPLSEKWNFKSWGRDMYYWRTIGRVKKYHAPHVLRGAVSREEALEMVPVDVMPPDMLPKELQEPQAFAPEAKPAKPTLKDRLMGAQQGVMEEVFEVIEEEPAQ
jgi:hypothetical protein